MLLVVDPCKRVLVGVATVESDMLVGDTMLELFGFGVKDELGVLEGEVPTDNDEVGDDVKVVLLEAVIEKEGVRDELEVTVGNADGVAVGVRDDEAVIDIVTLSVLLGDTGALGLMLALVQ